MTNPICGTQWLMYTCTCNMFYLDRGIIPTVNQGRTQECAFLVPKEDYIAVEECRGNTNGYICQKNGKSTIYL